METVLGGLHGRRIRDGFEEGVGGRRGHHLG